MKHIYAVTNADDLQKYQSFVSKIQPRLDRYLDFLKAAYSVTDLPRSVVWTDAVTATTLISDIPLPGYTNEYRTVFCPDPEVWREIYLHQLDGQDNTEIRKYYDTKLTENHVLQILGHEFVHHSELFSDGFDTDYESGIWFEVGMCEYISRRYFLTEEEFNEEAHINELLVGMFRERYGTHSLEQFGLTTYQGDYASIFFEYWRSFLAVKKIVEQHGGDIAAVFREYHRRNALYRTQALTEFFHVTI